MPAETTLVRQQTDTDPDNISPDDILATKNALEAQKRHAEEDAEKAAKASAAGNSAPNPGQSPLRYRTRLAGYAVRAAKEINGSPKGTGSIEPFHPPPYNGRLRGLVNLRRATLGRNTKQEPPTARQCTRGTMRSPSHASSSRARVCRKPPPKLPQYLGPPITNFGLETGFHVAARLEASATTSVRRPLPR